MPTAPTLNTDKTSLEGVLKIEPCTQFEDFRGEYVETYNENMYHQAGIDEGFFPAYYAAKSKDTGQR